MEDLYVVDGFNSSLQKMSVHVPLMTVIIIIIIIIIIVIIIIIIIIIMLF